MKATKYMSVRQEERCFPCSSALRSILYLPAGDVAFRKPQRKVGLVVQVADAAF